MNRPTYWRLCAAVDAEREIGRRRINRITATHSIPHGTPTGYRAHKRTGLVICDPCREAHRVPPPTRTGQPRMARAEQERHVSRPAGYQSARRSPGRGALFDLPRLFLERVPRPYVPRGAA